MLQALILENKGDDKNEKVFSTRHLCIRDAT